MVQTIIKPEQTHINVEFDLPIEFIGREVKVTFSPLDEVTQKNEAKWGDFLGILSVETGESIKSEIKKMRDEWDRDI